MEWRHSGSPRPKKSEVKKSAGKVLASIFWEQDGILLIDYLLTGQTINAEYYWSLLVQLEDILKENAAGRSPMESCSCMTMTQLTEHLQSRRNWTTWASSVLITHPILRIWLRQTTTFSLDWKKTIESSPFFVRRGSHCCRGDLVGRTTFWIFFEWLAKVRAKDYEVYWASWGVCWINPEFGSCSLFPSCRAKDLSAPPRMNHPKPIVSS